MKFNLLLFFFFLFLPFMYVLRRYVIIRYIVSYRYTYISVCTCPLLRRWIGKFAFIILVSIETWMPQMPMSISIHWQGVSSSLTHLCNGQDPFLFSLGAILPSLINPEPDPCNTHSTVPSFGTFSNWLRVYIVLFQAINWRQNTCFIYVFEILCYEGFTNYGSVGINNTFFLPICY